MIVTYLLWRLRKNLCYCFTDLFAHISDYYYWSPV
jgi:hypothetical protein